MIHPPPGIVAASGGAARLTGESGYTDAGTGSYRSALDGTLYRDRDGVTWAVAARMDSIPAATEFLLAKNTNAEFRIFATATNIQLRSVGGGVHTYLHRSEDVGRVVVLFLAKSNAEQKAYSYREHDRTVRQIGTTISAGITVSTNSSRLAIGTRAGDSPANEALSFTIISAGVWDAYLSEAQCQAVANRFRSTGRFSPSVVAGAEGIWNAANGWVDEVGSEDMNATENTPGDLTSAAFAPTYIGNNNFGVVHVGQSLAVGTNSVDLEWPSPYDVADAVSPITKIFHDVSTPSSVWETLDLNGDNFTSTEQVFGRELKTAAGGRPVYIVRDATGGTDLENDWEISPTPGTAWLDFTTTWASAVAALNIHDAITVEICVLHQGQADAGNEAKSLAYETNLDAWIDDFDAWAVSEGVKSSGLLFILPRVSDNSGQTYRANVQGAQDNVAAARTNVVLVNTDAVPMPDLDLHPSTAGYVEIGLAIGTAGNTRANATASAP